MGRKLQDMFAYYGPWQPKRTLPSTTCFSTKTRPFPITWLALVNSELNISRIYSPQLQSCVSRRKFEIKISTIVYKKSHPTSSSLTWSQCGERRKLRTRPLPSPLPCSHTPSTYFWNTVMKWTEYLVSLETSVVLPENSVMANRELISITEYMTI